MNIKHKNSAVIVTTYFGEKEITGLKSRDIYKSFSLSQAISNALFDLLLGALVEKN